MKTAILFAPLLLLLASCAPLAPELPSGDEQQLDRPATLPGTHRPGNPFDAPDEATLPQVPGQCERTCRTHRERLEHPVAHHQPVVVGSDQSIGRVVEQPAVRPDPEIGRRGTGEGR